MSYLVLARKYRPQTFEEIVGQQHVSRTLSNAIKQDRVAHAYLFTGTRGVGKTTAARVLAKALNCETGPTPTPCNTCINCRAITEGNSVDVFEIDGASNTGVDDVRELRDNARYSPQSSKYKIYVIDEVHMLSTSAFNALLKTLEEPPDHVIFIFATTEAHKIPETVLSRCQQYDFKMIPQRLIFDHLKNIVQAEKVKLEDASLRLIARKADGSMRDAMSFLDQALSYGGDNIKTTDLLEILGVVDRQVLVDVSNAILSGNSDETLEVMERLQGTTWDVKQFYGDLLEHFRNLVVAKISKKPEAMIDSTAEEIKSLTDQIKDVSLETLQRLFDLLIENEDLVIRSSNPRLVLEMQLLRMAYASPVASLDELVGQLAELKKTLSQPGRQGESPKRPFPQPKSNKAKTVEPDSTDDNVKAPTADETAPAPITDPSRFAEAFLGALKEDYPTLAPFFQNAELMEQSKKGLIYGIGDKFVINQIEQRRSELDQAFNKVAGTDAVVEIVFIKTEGAQNEFAKEKQQKQKAKERLAKLRRESMDNQVVRQVLDTFEGTKIAVEPINKKVN